ncbi:alanine--tRNA ligase [Roseivirga misakiensis]|uniref:Alanine--tRNA ligase n=1 Tax=Roseivirga misakiensis TaxID=1563681 RepID=A0A1E5T0D1_9BACT|nr:alanine--tRNA ligase [Roseivirga misakiensis]OEK04842.1 alanine--tRNA ligase [Roseivirga misakiensis]
MESREIRSKFIEFFESKKHKFVPSAPMVLKSDPTLMFTNAGMNQFKDLFLGNATADYTRAVNSQKCLRVSGKHNDLEEVGIDTYHHTMFEMLGNWSFGDYFKKDAISWAWELLIEVYGLEKDRLYVTVFEGDKEDNLAFDQEAYDYWKAFIDESRILNGDKKDNFWEMGDTGPCGPCSELHIDLRSEEERAKVPGKELVNQDHPQVIEVWNLVFMQFDRKSDGHLENLPAQHIDTGMGFERLAMALQGKHSNYDTDVFMPLIDAVSKKAGIEYGEKEETDIAIRVIVDHIRAISFAIADDQLPSNNKAGYVIRRILRRAVRYGYTFLNLNEPFLHELVAVLASQYKGFFDELESQKDLIAKVIKEEEASFLRTLENGLKRLEQIKQRLSKSGEQTIPGQEVFELYDTFGFPIDLTALIAREHNLSIDEAGFEKAMNVQKQRSKADAVSEKGDWITVNDEASVAFIGYDEVATDTTIIKYREIKEAKRTVYQVVLEKTPFYGESGGQIGDTGLLTSDTETIKVLDTKKENDLIVHFTDKLPENPSATFRATINEDRRVLIKGNHSATHLLHAALRDVLGTHVQQKGSLVSDQVLRFDFSHFSKVEDEQIVEIERIVNDRIRQNIALDEKRNVPIDQAKSLGAMALFGEKYGDFVRVIIFDPKYSVELCGGTHVNATGDIGLFKIVSESAVAAGIRRIEAYTGPKAFEHVQAQDKALSEVRDVLKNPKDLTKAITDLMDGQKRLTKIIDTLYAKQANVLKKSLLEEVSAQDGFNALVAKVLLPNADGLKKLAFELKNEVENLVAVLAADIDGKPQIAVIIADNLVKEKGLNAGQMVRELAKEIKGGGGGQPFFATAGGKDLFGLDKVEIKANEMIAAL